jgi:hypothetical protein
VIKKPSLLELDFGIGQYNGAMDIAIHVDNHCVANFNDIQQPTVNFSHYIMWPCTVTITVSGKNLNCDTQVDDLGNIVADKYVELQAVRVDHIEPGIGFIKSLVLDTGSDLIQARYWGFNGKVVIDFDQDDSFLWHLAQQVQQNQSYLVPQTRI